MILTQRRPDQPIEFNPIMMIDAFYYTNIFTMADKILTTRKNNPVFKKMVHRERGLRNRLPI